MATLSRTTSSGSVASDKKTQARSSNDNMQDLAAAELSGPPSPTNGTKPSQQMTATGRVPSHSLLTAPQNAAVPSRKSRFADAGTIGGSIERASISMPPPATKPSSIYRPSTVRRPIALQNAMDNNDVPSSLDGSLDERAIGATNTMEELDRVASSQSVPASESYSPLVYPESSLKPAASSLTKPGDRLSFSSLYSLGSAIYNGATGMASAPQSTASSTAGSVKSIEHPTATAVLIPPSLGSAKGEATSSATTATDPVSVIANSQSSHQGWIPI